MDRTAQIIIAALLLLVAFFAVRLHLSERARKLAEINAMQLQNSRRLDPMIQRLSEVDKELREKRKKHEDLYRDYLKSVAK